MRKSRIETCPPESALIHKYWQCHNKEHLLASPQAKALYCAHTRRALVHKSVQRSIVIRAFCYMDNHVHLLLEYKNGLDKLSNFMRVAHTGFGMALNKIQRRCGKVANDRAKTPLVEQESLYEQRVHMYIEANPLRAGLVRSLAKLSRYKYSSYGHYAYGTESEHSKDLQPPSWYLELGATPEERQRRYREMFRAYLNETGWVGKKGERSCAEGERMEILKDQAGAGFLGKRRRVAQAFVRLRAKNKTLSPQEIMARVLSLEKKKIARK